MPRAGRKKKGPGHVRNPSNSTIVYTKRQEIQDDDGWTHVVDAPRKRSSTLTKAANGGLHAGDFEINGVGYVKRTVEEMGKEFEFWRKSWEADAACAKLLDVLNGGGGKQIVEEATQPRIVEEEGLTTDPSNTAEESMAAENKETAEEKDIAQPDSAKIEPRQEKRNVDNIIVLGLGSLQSARREGRRATLTQLAALQTIIQHFEAEAETSKSLKVFLQDPLFTPLDIEYLQSFPNFEVVNDPDAFSKITQGSLIFAIHCYSQVYKAVSEGARPALLIGTDMGNFGRFNMSENAAEIQQSLEALIQNCEILDFPQVRHDFSDTKLYWRNVTQDPST